MVNGKGKWENGQKAKIRSSRTFQERRPSKRKIKDFNITYYPIFQNIRNLLQELDFLLPADKEHKKVFSDVPVVGFRNGKSLNGYLVRAVLLKTNETRRCEPCGRKTCLVCNSIRTTTSFTTEACGEVFKVQSGPLNCNSEKVL